MEETKPFRVLCLDGGGMRGAYQTAYLATFAERISEKLKRQGPLDVGSAFDLVVGTSTGGIVACGLAAGVPLTQMQELYAKAGKRSSRCSGFDRCPSSASSFARSASAPSAETGPCARH